MDLLPHRYPFLMVDRVDDYEISDERKTLRAIKNVSFNEPIFQGHFPAKPVFPGVLILEAMAQIGGIAMLYPEENRGKIALFGGMENVKFKRPVVPGDQLIMKAELLRVRGDFGKLHAESYVGDQFAAQGDFTFALKRTDNK